MKSKLYTSVSRFTQLPFLLLTLLVLVAATGAAQHTTVLPNNGSYSQQISPQGGFRYQRQFYLITPAEVKASGLQSGTALNSIGFTIGAAQSDTTKGKFIVYLQNTQDTVSRTDTAWTVINSTTNSYNLTGLTPGRYEWQVQSVCTGSSAGVASAAFTNDNLTGCNPPTNLTTNSITATAATFNWVAPVSSVTKYYLQYSRVDTANWILDSTSAISYTAAALTANKLYQWRIWTKCSGDSSTASTTYFSTNSVNSCNAPSALTNVSSTDVSASISWTIASGATRYDVQYRRAGTATWYSAIAFSNGYTITGLSSGTSYEWQVRTVCAAGTGAYITAPSTFTTTGTTICYAPTNLTTNSITSSGATLSWSAVSGAASYTIRYRQKQTIAWTNAITPMTVVHNDSLVIPATVGAYDVTFKNGNAFTYTGGGLYVAFEYSRPSGILPTLNTALSTTKNTSIKGASGQDSVQVILSLGDYNQSSLPTVLKAGNLRPETRLGAATLSDSVEVAAVYASGYSAVPYSTPTPVAALIKNYSTASQSYLVTLTVKDVATNTVRYTATQNITVADSSSQVVTFTGWQPTLLEKDSIIISVPAQAGENVTGNNSNYYLQNVNNAIQSYADSSAAISAAGYSTSTGLLLNRYTMKGCGKLNAAQVYLSSSAKTHSIYAVALDASGAIIAQSSPFTPDSTQVNNYYSFYFPTPPLVKDADYYIGVAQTSTGYTPVGIQWEGATPRSGAYYRAGLTGSNLIDTPQQGRLMIRAEIIPGMATPAITGKLSLCAGATNTLKAGSVSTRFANSVIGFSSQNSTNKYSAIQALGTPNVYPFYGSSADAWTSSTGDGQREYLALGFSNPAPVNFVDIYETYNPGAVDTVYVKNPSTGAYDVVYSGADSVRTHVARIKHITFPLTSYNVSEIRIAINSPVVSGFNSIDAVGIGRTDTTATFATYAWSPGGAATPSISVNTAGTYSLAVTDVNNCAATASATVFTPVQTIPTITATGSTTICQGDSVKLTSSQLKNNTWSTGATTQSIYVKAAGSYTVTYNDGTGCGITTSAPTAVTVNPLPVVTITGSLGICPGGSTILNAGSGYTNYLWSTGATMQTITVTAAGGYSVTVKNSNGCSGTNSVTTYNAAVPTAAITGNLTFCPGNATTLNAGSGYSHYAWSTGDATQTIAASTAGSYQVTVTNANGCTASASVITSLYNAPAPSISGATSFCPGSSTTLDAGSGYAQYAWSNAAAIQTISVNTTGNYSVMVTDTHGCTGNTSVVIGQYAAPSPAISGTLSFCGGSSTTLDAGLSYNSYLWNTGATTHSIIANAVQTYSVTVTDTHGCTGSASATTTQQSTLPATPGPIIGPTGGVCNSTGNVYTISPVPNASYYVWTVPTGAIITSDQTSTSITVSFSNSYTSGNIIVAAANTCGQSSSINQSTLAVTAVPDMPATISGPASGVCSQTNAVYSIAGVASATSYTWTLPSGATIVNGQGTTAITVSFSGAFTSGNICVKANSTCGASVAKCITVAGVPAMPVSISGPAVVCSKQQSIIYSVTPVAGASSYTWTIPQQAIITSGLNTNTIHVNFGVKGGTVSVKANSGCGSSGVKSLNVSMGSCATITAAALSAPTDMSVQVTSLKATAIPNPSNTYFTLNISSNNLYETVHMRVIDAVGRVLEGRSLGANGTVTLGADFRPGIYYAELVQGKERTTIKLVKQSQ